MSAGAEYVDGEAVIPRQDGLPDFNARRVMLTHMNPTMLAKVEEAKAAGVLVAEDGLTLDL